MNFFISLLILGFCLPSFAGFSLCPELFHKGQKLNVTQSIAKYKSDLAEFKSQAPGQWANYKGNETLHYQSFEPFSGVTKGILLFIPGLGSDGLQLKSQSSYFNEYRRQGYRVYTLELPGQGFTLAAQSILNPATQVEFTTKDLVEAVDNFYDQVIAPLKASSIELMGHSFGGQLTSAFMAQSPHAEKIKRVTLLMPGVVTLDRIAYANYGDRQIQLAHSAFKTGLEAADLIPRSGIGFIDRLFHPAENYYGKGISQFESLFPGYVGDNTKIKAMMGLTLGSSEQNTIENISNMRRQTPVTLVIASNEDLLPADLHYRLGVAITEKAGGRIIIAKNTEHNFMNSPFRDQLGKAIFNINSKSEGFYQYNPNTNYMKQKSPKEFQRESIISSNQWFLDPNGIWANTFGGSSGTIKTYKDYLISIDDQESLQILNSSEKQPTPASP